MPARVEAPQHAMPDTSTPARRPRPFSPAGLAAAAAGVALFVYFVERTGAANIAAGAGRLGWTFPAIVALGGLRLAARALAWRNCLDDRRRLTRRHAFCAVVAGDTLGNLTPLGPLAGEPAKALFAVDREPAARTLPALAVENLFFTLSAALVVAGGAIALVLRLGPAHRGWMAGAALAATLVLLIMALHGVMWRRRHPASGLLAGAARLGPAANRLGGWAERVRRVEHRVHDLYPRAPRRLAAVAGWELGFHALAILEIHLVLAFVSAVPPTLLDAFVLESTNRLLAAAFKVVPLRIGVDEAGAAAVAELLALGGGAGVTLAIVRKARMLVWMAAGIVLLARRGLLARRRGGGAAAADGPEAPAPSHPAGARQPEVREAVAVAADSSEEPAPHHHAVVVATDGPVAPAPRRPAGARQPEVREAVAVAADSSEEPAPHRHAVVVATDGPVAPAPRRPAGARQPEVREAVAVAADGPVAPAPRRHTVVVAADSPEAPAPRGPAVVVMARSPRGARAPKTRLAGVLTDVEDRRRLYAAFLTDVVSACRTVAGTTVRVAYTPDGGPLGFAPVGIAGGELMPQRGASLGDRERGVFEDLFRSGFSPVVVIGSDLPGLPAARIGEAIDRLAAARDTAVLGPTPDGGYYLLGLARPGTGRAVPDLFTGIRWSSARTRADTVAAAERCGLQVVLLDPWRDVDDAADLAELRITLAGPGSGRAPATASVLQDLAARNRGLASRGGPPSP